MEEHTSFQSSWTLAEALIWEIAGHLKSARTFWISGNLDKYFWELECVVRVLYGMLDEKEKVLANNKETEILTYLPTILNKDKIKALAGLLKEYDGMIMTFIHTHKLDMPPKRDRTVMIA